MFEEWGGIEWVLLVINSIALYIAGRFLIRKLKKKFEEVEKRQAFHRRMNDP